MKSVLVVDSSSEIRATLKDILILKGYNVVGEASSTFEATEKSEVYKPDIITKDITLLVMNDKNIINEISEFYHSSNILVLLEKNKIFLI